MLVPFTGFPEIVRESLIVLAGLLIAIFGFSRSYNSYAIDNQSVVNVTEEDENPVKESKSGTH